MSVAGKRDTFAIILCCLLALVFSGSIGWAQQITLKSHAVVHSAQISLGMVAQLSPASALLAEKRLARAPKPAKTKTLSRQQIEKTLRQNGVNIAQLTWAGASAVTVEGASQTITNDDVQQEIDAYLRDAESRYSYANFKFTPFTPVKDFVLPAGVVQVDVIPAVRDIIGSRHFTLVYRVDGRTVQNLAVRGKLLVEADVVVAQQPLRRGVTISVNDVAVTTLDISRLRDPLFNLNDVVGKRVARNVRAGQVIERKNVEFPPVVKKGAFVRIVARRGAMMLSAIGIARQDGQLEEVIRVQNSSSQKQIRARVVGPDQVEVEF